MAKITYSSLKLKTKEDIKEINFNDSKIEVKQYLPIADKIDLVDQSFLENYLNNQTIIEAITKELVKIQKEDEGKETIKEHA